MFNFHNHLKRKRFIAGCKTHWKNWNASFYASKRHTNVQLPEWNVQFPQPYQKRFITEPAAGCKTHWKNWKIVAGYYYGKTVFL